MNHLRLQHLLGYGAFFVYSLLPYLKCFSKNRCICSIIKSLLWLYLSLKMITKSSLKWTDTSGIFPGINELISGTESEWKILTMWPLLMLVCLTDDLNGWGRRRGSTLTLSVERCCSSRRAGDFDLRCLKWFTSVEVRGQAYRSIPMTPLISVAAVCELVNRKWQGTSHLKVTCWNVSTSGNHLDSIFQ